MKELLLNKIWQQDCLSGLRELPDTCVQVCVTSPPYWRLRDYGVAGQLGHEATPELYIERMVEVFTEVRRVLRADGTFWLNIGDCYWGSGKMTAPGSKNKFPYGPASVGKHEHIKDKDLVGIPWMLAFALRSQGWYLRQDIIWHKKNGMPESVRDRCTRAHETIFMFAKSSSYYYDADAIKTPLAQSTLKDKRLSDPAFYNRLKNFAANALRPDNGEQYKSAGLLSCKSDKQGGHGPRHRRFNERWRKRLEAGFPVKGANRRTVWALPYQPFKGNHFAAFPPALPELCIKAGSRPGDIVLDPFMGAGTTAVVAAALNRSYIGFELNPAYVALAEDRIRSEIPRLNTTSSK